MMFVAVLENQRDMNRNIPKFAALIHSSPNRGLEKMRL